MMVLHYWTSKIVIITSTPSTTVRPTRKQRKTPKNLFILQPKRTILKVHIPMGIVNIRKRVNEMRRMKKTIIINYRRSILRHEITFFLILTRKTVLYASLIIQRLTTMAPLRLMMLMRLFLVFVVTQRTIFHV